MSNSEQSVRPAGPSAPSLQPASLPRSIAIVTCSTRPSRIGHIVTNWVQSTITPLLPAHYKISIIDLANINLPLFDEDIPAYLPKIDPTPHYIHAHSRAWSAEVRRHDAFIFVTPQYNWGYPAAVKNALDYLYHEWTAKPAFVISYGGHGGGKGGEQLVQVLKGLRMKVGEVVPGLKIDVGESEAVRRNGRFSEERREVWRDEGEEEKVRASLGKMVGLVDE